jgi:hypothetical protein
MRKLLRKYLLVGMLILAGLAGGFLFWRFLGCTSGSCPITSKWYASSLIGGLIGFLAGDSVNDFIKKKSMTKIGD